MERTDSKSYLIGFLPYALAAFLIGIIGGFTTVLGPAFVKDLGLEYNNTTWTALAMSISTAAFAPILGKLGDVIGSLSVRLNCSLTITCDTHIGGKKSKDTDLAGELYEAAVVYSVGCGTFLNARVDASEYDEHHRVCKLHSARKHGDIRICYIHHVYRNVSRLDSSWSACRSV